eukprot:g31915.t1
MNKRHLGHPGGQSSSGAAKPTASPPGGDEVRQINRELQRLDDVIRPLEDILENPPSSETAELVDIYLSEAQKKVEELQLHADFCVEQGHFDVFQRIADCKSNFDELSVRANSWKEAASHQELQSSCDKLKMLCKRRRWPANVQLQSGNWTLQLPLFQRQDVDTGRLSQHTQLLQRAIEDATAAGLQTSQADELLRQAKDAQNSLRRFPPTATLPEQARDAPAQPFPSPSSAFGAEAKETDAHWQAFPAPSPQRQASPVAEAKETDARWQAFPAPSPASRQTSPVTEVAPAASIQMKDKVGKLLQTLLVGGSTSEQLRKAVEVAKVAGLDPERCEHALQVAEMLGLQADASLLELAGKRRFEVQKVMCRERSLAHREAAAALSSGDGAAMRHALFHLESAGGPAADRRQILQVLEMAGKGSVPSSCQLRSAADRESFKAKEEQLLQHLKEAREQDLEDFRAAVSAWTQSRARIYAAPDPEPDARSGMATEPTTKVDEPPAFQHGWTNPFGLDPTREVFNPFPPPVEYGTLLTNAHHRAKLQGQAFEHPDFWRMIQEEVKRDPEFHVSRQVTRQRNLGLEIPQVQALLASARCVSLGTSCSVAAALQALDLRGEAGPFDWLRTFWHHDVTDINVRLAFDRRIERFLRIPAGRDMIFLRAMNHLEDHPWQHPSWSFGAVPPFGGRMGLQLGALSGSIDLRAPGRRYRFSKSRHCSKGAGCCQELDEIMDLFLILKLHFQKARRVRLAVLIDLQEAEGAFSTRELGPDQDCYPYSWWRLEALPEWAGGELAFLGALPWQYTEYPSLYGGPCNVNRDASVKPTDAVIFLYAHADSKHFRRALDAAASAWKYCCSPCFPQQDPFDFRCEMCHAGKMHRKRVALEQCWQAALEASKHQPLMEVTCNLRNRQLPQQAQHSGAKASKFAAAPRWACTWTWQLRLQADSSTTDFKNQVLLQLNLPTAELGRYHFVTNGQLMGDVGKLSGLLKDGDNVVVVPPRVPAHLRRIKAIYHWMAWLLRRLGAVLFMFCRFAWILPGTVLRYTLDAWYDPWSLVRPRGEEVRGRHLRGLGIRRPGHVKPTRGDAVRRHGVEAHASECAGWIRL